uniref:Ubiquitinyl hydrolase 1 n=1 Tax=Rhabditophanes sp. KR3021 TaxID=114890 RepID=A0AC35U1F5_9BILA
MDDSKPVKEEGKTLQECISQDESAFYEKSRAFAQEIEEKQRAEVPLLGEKLTIGTLIESYDETLASEYYARAVTISGNYNSIRRVRGDGNCYYRAYMTALFELCCKDGKVLEAVTKVCDDLRPKFVELGFPELTTGDFCDAVQDLLVEMKEGKVTSSNLFEKLGNENIANYYIAWSRIAASAFLRANAEEYEVYMEQTLIQFCQEEIEPMWHDADSLAIIALVRALGQPVQIEYMDRSLGDSEGNFHKFPDHDAVPVLYLLFTIGHYDILYKD